MKEGPPLSSSDQLHFEESGLTIRARAFVYIFPICYIMYALTHIVMSRLLGWTMSPGTSLLMLFLLHSSLLLAHEVLDLFGGLFDIMIEEN